MLVETWKMTIINRCQPYGQDEFIIHKTVGNTIRDLFCGVERIKHNQSLDMVRYTHE